MKQKIKIDNSQGTIFYTSKFKIKTHFAINYKELLYIQYRLEEVVQELKNEKKKKGSI